MQIDLHLKALFEPDTIAVIGATPEPGTTGHAVTANLLASGYKGKIFPVNPKGEEVLGLKACKEVCDIPRFTDLAIICLPPTEALKALEILGDRPVRSAIVTSPGFGETGKEGYMLERRLARIAKASDMAVLGPNCYGMMNTELSMNASLFESFAREGNISFFAHSGAVCCTAVDWANSEFLGFSKFLSLGNKAVLSESRMLRYLASDPGTKVILGYCENLEDGQDFVRIAQDATAKKPFILLRAGETPDGAQAASAHAGALTGAAMAYDAAFRQSGILKAVDIEDMFNMARAFSFQPLPEGPSVAIVTNSGGPGIIAADMCEKGNLSISRPLPESIEKMRSFLPSYASFYNPVDMVGEAGTETYARTMEVVAEDDRFNAIIVILTPAANIHDQINGIADEIIKASRNTRKPVIACLMGRDSVAEARRKLLEAKIPCYEYPETAVRCLDAMYQCHRWQNRECPIDVCFRRDITKARSVVETYTRIGLNELVELDAQNLASAYELPIPETILARTSNQAVKAAKRIGYPVVLKIASPQISRKGELGLIMTGIESPAELRKAFLNITSLAARRCKDAYIHGCLVQAMGPENAQEAVIKFRRDPQFGPVITFSLAGLHADMLGDVSSRLAPLSLNDAQEMIREIKAYPILRGVDSGESADLGAIEDILLMISQMATDLPEIQEAEFNPVIAGPDGAVVANMRMTVG
ncbi:acetate--CoA ligase family protein [Maridesulfovibrio bastinii]|uniref:acetate--CoA ligase family protein n=1 Tax=Maridesulfovibrio bastinii TaxID=47157 RepID=UPI00041F0B97|nr:acetate--CoA ligase [Maridesulfovibrio bastinii]